MYIILSAGLHFVNRFLIRLCSFSFSTKTLPSLSLKMHIKKEVSFLKPLFETVPSPFYIWLTNVSMTFSAAPNAAAATL